MKTDPSIPGPLNRKNNIRLTRPRIWIEHATILLLEVLPRSFDIILSLMLIALLSPFLLARGILGMVNTGKVFETVELIGRFRTPFHRLRFSGSSLGSGLAVLFNILRGDMAFAGPRPMTVDEALHLKPEQGIRFTLRPGIFSPHSLRRKIGIAHDSETVSDIDFYYNESVQGDMGLVAVFSLCVDVFWPQRVI